MATELISYHKQTVIIPSANKNAGVPSIVSIISPSSVLNPNWAMPLINF